MKLRLFPVVLVFLSVILIPLQSAAQYQINGNAAQTSCNCYRLTPANNGQNGSVWNVNLFDLSNSFNFTFDVFLGCNGGGADGLAFVLQPLSVNAGSSGGGIGYQGINPSFAVELDTYQNGGEPAYDHMAFQTNGVVSHGGPNTLAGPTPISGSVNNVEDCAWHQLNVVWDAVAMTMTVYFDGVLRLTYTGNIVNNLFGGNPNVYWGFTAATGGANNLHQFCNALNPALIVTSPVQCAGTPVDFQSSSVVSTGLITGFQWDFGDGATATGTQVSHTYAAAGTYTVTLTITSEGCTASNSVQVTINPAPSFSLGLDQSICAGDSYQMAPTGLAGGETAQWSPTTALTNPSISNPSSNPASNTTYTLTITDANGCTNTDDIGITVNPLPTANAGPDQTICTGSATAMAASGGVQYSWNPTTDLANASSATTQASPTITTNYTVTVTDANGCIDTDDMLLSVNALPVVSAGADNSMCNGQTVQLSASGAVSYSWSPSTGLSNASISNPIFSGVATSTFTATGTDGNGCVNTDDVTITVFALPTASFPQPADVCLGNATEFTDNSVGTGLNYTWDFGDSSPLNYSQSPTHTYASDGTFTVTLSITDVNGCSNTTTQTATVNPLPVAIAGIDQSICLNTLTTMAASGGLQYSWNPVTDLVDATSATTQASPSSTTTYTVTVTDANGCIDTDDMTITVNPLPVPTINVVGGSVYCEDEVIQFQNATVGNITDVLWDFGDNNFLPAFPNTTSTLNNPSFAYGNFAFGPYTVRLGVTDNLGCYDQASIQITINDNPVAEFDQPTDVCLGDPTVIIDNSTGTGLVYAWNFGDGTAIDASASPTHTYAIDGTFNIGLTLVDVNGCQATASSTATVLPLPNAAMNINTGEDFCQDEVIQFMNESTGNITDVLWNFGNNAFLPAFPNATSTLDDPTFAYNNFAFSPYTVTLGVTNSAGCYDQTQVVVVIHDKPIAEFSSTNACEGDATQFTDESTVNSAAIDGWKWQFGNNNSSSVLQNPTYSYPQAGVYQVQLIVETEFGCLDTVLHDVIVNPTPVMSISGIDTCLNDETSFVNNSVPQDNTILSWDWDFGDGTTANSITTAHTYTNHGVYTVSLTATSDSGCVATGTTQIEVFPNPIPAFQAIEAEGCAPLDVLFLNQSTIASGFISSYEWNLGDSTFSTASSPQNTYPDSGYYDITLSVTSAEGCNTVLFADNAIRANITPIADFTINEDVLSLLDAEVVLTDQSQHGLIWDWNLGDGTSSSAVNPTHIYTEPGIYDLSLTVINGDCEDTKYGQVKVEPIYTFYIPSAFTPDDDGLNETFFGTGESVKTYNMKISDRWGEMIFESNEPDFHWDGTYKGKQVEQGNYVYEFNLLDLFGNQHRYLGVVTLMR
ncbi:MAG: PKD domain-containing protein [Flavobacteriales bacterium]|nr:PKD domain-containing protein [Flavobacteriales bacterium]